MKHDPLEKTTRIPFRVVDGQLVHFYDGELISELREGATGEIIVNDFKIEDKTRVQQYNVERQVDLLPEGTMLLARISLLGVPKHLKQGLSDEGNLIGDGKVAIVLGETLRLHLRGTKDGQLLPCKCQVPSLVAQTREETPLSINQAYTLISEYFEPHRRSHTGNVFERVFFKHESPKYGWLPLRVLRDWRQAEHESAISTKPVAKSSSNRTIKTRRVVE